MENPKQVNLTPQEIEALVFRIINKSLQEGDYALILEVINAMIWLSQKLAEKKLTIKKLRKIFGVRTETAAMLLKMAAEAAKKAKKKQKATASDPSSEASAESNKDAATSTPETNTSEAMSATSGSEASAESNKDAATSTPETNTSEAMSAAPGKDDKKGHGHRPASDYTQAKIIDLAHQTLQKGAQCPACGRGKLFPLSPGQVIRIVGQPWLQVEVYKPERLRCSVCGKTFTAKLPREVIARGKTDYTAKAIVCLLKYSGVPFYRQEQMLKSLDAHQGASSLWEMTEDVADALHPIYSLICQKAAAADVIHNDDTPARILSLMKAREETKESEKERSGMFTTGLIAMLNAEKIQIALFFTGRQHAGENLNDLLMQRPEGLPIPIQQSDALSRNKAKDCETQRSYCNVHARRNFYELVDEWPKIITHIIGLYEKIFIHEKEAPKEADERLKWHQKYSAPVMEELKTYCNALIETKQVEPNSNLGKAIVYLNNYWDGLTLFLKIPNVPIDNNVCERSLKKVVLNRKNAYFFRNETGAKIGDILLSMQETCRLNRTNPYEYMVVVQQNQTDVRRNPHLWMPWNFRDRLSQVSCPESALAGSATK